MAQMTLSTERKRTHRHGEKTCGCQGGAGGSGMDWDLGGCRFKLLLWSGWVMRLSIAQGTICNHLWWNMMEDNVREWMCIYILHIELGHFAVQQKLIEHCWSTIIKI